MLEITIRLNESIFMISLDNRVISIIVLLVFNTLMIMRCANNFPSLRIIITQLFYSIFYFYFFFFVSVCQSFWFHSQIKQKSFAEKDNNKWLQSKELNVLKSQSRTFFLIVLNWNLRNSSSLFFVGMNKMQTMRNVWKMFKEKTMVLITKKKGNDENARVLF